MKVRRNAFERDDEVVLVLVELKPWQTGLGLHPHLQVHGEVVERQGWISSISVAAWRDSDPWGDSPRDGKAGVGLAEAPDLLGRRVASVPMTMDGRRKVSC